MKKRMYTSVLAAVLILSLFASAAFAETVTNSNLEIVQQMVDETNASIARDVARTQEVADRIIDIFGDNFITRYIIARLIDALEDHTNAKAQATMDAAAEMGFEVHCEIEVFIIGGQKAYIDPLYVISD